MATQNLKIIFSIVITALVVGSIVYFFTNKKIIEPNLETATEQSKSDIFSQTSKEYAVMGRQAWSAFECSAWASKIGEDKEAERLFNFGYDQGKKFLGALKVGKINQEDISSEVPIGVTMLLQGPTEEFILGRIYETCQEEALKDVFNSGDQYNTEELQKSIAENKFMDANCQLIGK